MSARCSECGDTRKLTPDGVCEWRAGCEHRVRVREARFRGVIEEAEMITHLARTSSDFLRDLGFHLREDDE